MVSNCVLHYFSLGIGLRQTMCVQMVADFEKSSKERSAIKKDQIEFLKAYMEMDPFIRDQTAISAVI